MIRRVTCIFAAAMLFSACTKTEMTEIKRQEIADTIREITAEGLDRARVTSLENFNAWMADWVESDDEAWLNNPAMYVNRLNILTTKEWIDEVWRPTVERRSATHIDIVKDYVAVLSVEHALHVFEARWSVADMSGNITSEGPMTATTVWTRKNGEWKTLHYHQSWDSDSN